MYFTVYEDLRYQKIIDVYAYCSLDKWKERPVSQNYSDIFKLCF